MTYNYDAFQDAAAKNPAPDLNSGASGYFSKPQATLDPHLFDGEHLKAEVRSHILGVLHDWLAKHNLNQADQWLRVWIAGSGITYQWAAGRGNGDLDVLFGVDYGKFLQANAEFDAWSEYDFAQAINSELKITLWPGESSVNFGGQVYEVTYFNNGSDDIDTLHPYAAYDVVKDTWHTRPPELPGDPRVLYPMHWYEATDLDRQQASGIVSRYTQEMANLSGSESGSPGWHNAGAKLNLVSAQAQALWSDIHMGRQQAFSMYGQGYGDYNNFRWQRGKELGTIQALHAITTVGVEARHQEERDLYGAPIDGADIALRRAAMAHRQGWTQ